MSNDSLENRILRCQKGDPDGFSWLLSEYGPKLYRYFLRLNGSKNDAEDLLQELFTKLLVNIKKYEHKGQFESWIFRVALNLVRDQHRKKQRQVKTISMNQEVRTEDQDGPIMEFDSDMPPPEERLLQNEQIDQMQDALKQLGEIDREIIMMRHYGGLSFKEIAEHFQLPVGTVLAKVHRGLIKIRKVMES